MTKFLGKKIPEYFKEYTEQLKIIEKAMEENMPFNEFMEKYPDQLIIVLGPNDCGEDIVNLDFGTLHDWTY